MTKTMVIQPAEYRQDGDTNGDHQQEQLTFPLKDVVMWIRNGGKAPDSQFEATQRKCMHESLEMTLGNVEDSYNDCGYEVESEEDFIAVTERQDPSLPLLMDPVYSSEEEEAEKGYEGDNDHDDSDNRSHATIDSLVLAAKRLPHLTRHPQRFGMPQKPKPIAPRVPRRRGARVSCVLRRKAALERRAKLQEAMSPIKKKDEEKEDIISEAKDRVPALRSSCNRLRSQDSLPLTRERLEHQHQFSSDDDDSFLSEEDLGPTFRSSITLLRSQDSILLSKERLKYQHQASSESDDSFFHEEIVAPIQKASSSVGFKPDVTFMNSPRAITNTQSHDALLPLLERSPRENETTAIENPIDFPSLSVE